MDIKKLIPQRSPIMMVDELLCVNGDEAICQLTINADNWFIDNDKLLAEPGLIEHIAQSASAFAGYKALQEGASTPPIGYIGEVKNFHLYRRPNIGEVLTTTIVMGAEIEGITIITGKTFVGEELIADTAMKIFIKE